MEGSKNAEYVMSLRSNYIIWQTYWQQSAFTRTLTTLYSMTLLSLLAHVQLNILGRMKYMLSVVNLAHEERNRDIMRDRFSILNLLLGVDPEERYPIEDIYSMHPVREETERKYLTLSWWLLHVGWKDVGERVRRAVEEVFDE